MKYVKNLAWKYAGLALIISDAEHFRLLGGTEHSEKTRKDIDYHDLVANFLVRHSGEEDFDEKYFHRPFECKYYKILELAEAELKKVA